MRSGQNFRRNFTGRVYSGRELIEAERLENSKTRAGASERWLALLGERRHGAPNLLTKLQGLFLPK